MAEPMVLTVEQCAKRLAISRSAAYDAIAAGTLPAVRIGRRSLRVPVASLERFLDVQPTTDPAPTIGFRPATKRKRGGRGAG
jgi:excisionase family DNA binding protein